MRDIFASHYQNNYWNNDESVSGHGSTMLATDYIRQQLPRIFDHFGVHSVLDIPCGDYNWFSAMMTDVHYIGADVVPELIASNQRNYPGHDFRLLDITTDPLPLVSLIFCRDLLGHFSNSDVRKALKNIKKSGATYLMATTFPGRKTAGDIKTGEWRPIDLDYLWGLPERIGLLNEHCTAGGGEYADKSLGLWKLQE